MSTNGKRTYTEADLLALLDRRVEKKGPNGPAAVVLHHVRSAAGFDARRTIDAVSMGFYPSRGLHLHGYEVKTSRSDWLRELKNADKAEEFAGRLDFLSVVAADDSVVAEGELPAHWGLLVVQGGRLVQKVAPTYLHDETLGALTGRSRTTALPPAFGRTFLVCLLRQASRRAAVTPEEVAQAVDAANAKLGLQIEREMEQLRARAEAAETTINDFQTAAQVSMRGRFGYGRDPEEVGRALRLVLDGDDRIRKIEGRLEQLARTAEGIRQEVEAHVAHYQQQFDLSGAS